MEAGLSGSVGRNLQPDSPSLSAGGLTMATKLSWGQVDVYLTAQQEIALQAAAHQVGLTTVGDLLQHVVWGMAKDMLEDAGVAASDSGPTTYDKVRALCAKEAVEHGC